MLSRKMKKSAISLQLHKILFFLSFSLFAACTSDENKMTEKLVGSWEVYNFEVENEASNSELIKMAKDIAFSVKYEFKSDFTYSIHAKTLPNGEYGTWSWNEQSKELELLIPQEYPQSFTILRCDDDVSILESKIPPFGKVKTYLRRMKKEVQ